MCVHVREKYGSEIHTHTHTHPHKQRKDGTSSNDVEARNTKSASVFACEHGVSIVLWC
jgi:hypothetical protein